MPNFARIHSRVCFIIIIGLTCKSQWVKRLSFFRSALVYWLCLTSVCVCLVEQLSEGLYTGLVNLKAKTKNKIVLRSSLTADVKRCRHPSREGNRMMAAIYQLTTRENMFPLTRVFRVFEKLGAIRTVNWYLCQLRGACQFQHCLRELYSSL